MYRKLLGIGLLVISLSMLTGCEFIDQLVDAIAGIGGPGGGAPSTGVVSGRMEFHLWGNISEDGGSDQGPIGTVFWSGSGSYDPATKTFTATWNGGDFSDTYFEARLNATEEYIEYFYARQTQAEVFGAWTYVHEIEGRNVLYSHDEGSSRYFIVDGSDAHVIVETLTYKAWSTALGSETSPVYWASSPGALLGNTSDIIQIRLDY